MTVGKTGWIAVFVGAFLLLGIAVRLYRPGAPPLPDCAPEKMKAEQDGSLHCVTDGEGNLSAAQRLGLGGKLSLNGVSVDELMLVQGIGPKLAETILNARPDGGFSNWDEVNAIPGIGPSKLLMLQKTTDLR